MFKTKLEEKDAQEHFAQFMEPAKAKRAEWLRRGVWKNIEFATAR